MFYVSDVVRLRELLCVNKLRCPRVLAKHFVLDRPEILGIYLSVFLFSPPLACSLLRVRAYSVACPPRGRRSPLVLGMEMLHRFETDACGE